MRAVVAAAALLGLVGLVAAGCGGASESQELEFRIYDPAGKVRTEVTSADIVRSSARAVPLGEGNASVSIALTASGASKLCRLTRALAHRGATARKRQPFAIAIDDHVRRPVIDHEATPDGLCGAPGVQLEGIALTRALELAELIRESSSG